MQLPGVLPVIITLLFSIPAAAQPLPQLKEYLQLSESQLEIILANNDEYNRWAAEKQLRAGQVQGEIAAETARPVPDAGALGVRYVELETICREIKSQTTAAQKKNVDTLTAPQKAKLTVLQDAIKLAPVIAEAQFGNLLGTPGYFPPYFAGGSGGGIGIITGILTPATGCHFAPFPQFPAGSGSPASAPLLGRSHRQIGDAR